MTRYLALGALAGCALLAVLYGFQSAELERKRAALELATDYINATKEVRDATADLPHDPDAVLAELCRIAPRGPGCGDP